MTLIISVATQRVIVQASDRRVTSSVNGKSHVLDDERNKAIYLHCRDAQACISFAGVARIKGTPTSDFIANHLGGANVSEMLFNQVVRELEGPVIEALRQQEMDWQLPHLSMLVLSGYQYSGLPGPKQKISSVHGCIATGPKAPWTEVFSAEGRENIRVFGKTQAVEDSLKEHIIGLSRQSFFQTSDAAAVADQLVDFIRTAAKQPWYGSTIGPNCLSIAMYSDFRVRAESRYHPSGHPAQSCIPILLITGSVPLSSLPPEVIRDGFTTYPIKYFTDEDMWRKYQELREKSGCTPGTAIRVYPSATEEDMLKEGS